MLIHNVSHSDVVLDLNSPSMSLPPSTVMARPKFSCFYDLHYSIHEEIAQSAAAGREVPVVCHPVYEDLGSSSPLPHKPRGQLDTERPTAEPYIARCLGETCDKDYSLYYGAGFSLLDLNYIVSELGMLRYASAPCTYPPLHVKYKCIAYLYHTLNVHGLLQVSWKGRR